jgi:hypothetical protein
MKLKLLFVPLCLLFTGSVAVAQDTSVKSDAKLLEDLSKKKLYRSAINYDTIPSNARRALLIYGNESQQGLNEQLTKLTQLEELQLSIDSFEELSFDFLPELPNLKILSISFFVSGEGIFRGSWGTARPLDVSFLKKFPELRLLSIRWEGTFVHAEALLSLPKLIYLGVPRFSFNPIFFQSKSLQQLEMGDESYVLFSKNSEWTSSVGWSLEVKVGEPSELFSGNDDQYMDFLKQLKKSSKSEEKNWLFPILKTDSLGDTLFFLSDVSKEMTTWKMRYYKKELTFSGSMIQKTEGSRQFYNRLESLDSEIGREVFQEGDRTKIIQPRRESDGSTELTRIEETNYLNNQRDGVSLIYYPNKTIKERRMYELGKQIGEAERIYGGNASHGN